MQYQIEDKILLNNFLDKRLFNNELNKKLGKKEDEFSKENLELIIRPECNQKCDYCYITQHGNELYPIEERVDNLTLLNNLKILLDYLNYRQCYIKHWDLFAGDLFYDDFFFEIMDIFYNYFKELSVKNIKIFKEEISDIMIPCNFSFCHSKEKVNKVQEYIDKFKQLKVSLRFSWSHDGYYGIKVREKRELNQEFYNNVFNFLQYNGLGAHGMISYENIDYAIQNYNWWKNQYNLYLPERNQIMPYLLEVRNDGWTEEKIQKYLEFLGYVLEDKFTLCNRNPEIYISLMYGTEEQKKAIKCPNIYLDNDFSKLFIDGSNRNKRLGCGFSSDLSITLNNLSFVPCHRLTYPQFRGGKIIDINNNLQKINNKYLNTKITELEKTNVKNLEIDCDIGIHGYLNSVLLNKNCRLGCYNCEYKGMCVQGCLGAQYEIFTDFSIPIPSVCILFKNKINFILNKYKEWGVLDILLNNKHLNLTLNKTDIQYLHSFCERKGLIK